MRARGGPAAPAVPVARGVATSLGFQLVAKALHLGLNVVSSVAVIRYLAPAELGDFVLVVSLVRLLGLVCDFGLVKLAVREIVRDEAAEPSILGTVLVARLGLAAASAALVQVVLLALGRPGELRAAAAVASLFFVADAVLAVTMAFHVRLQQQYEALALVVGEAVETGLVLWLVSHHGRLVALLAAPVVGAAVAAAVAVAIARRRYSLGARFDASRLAPMLRASAPLALSGMIGIVVIKLDGVMLAALRPAREVGIYGAAFQPVEYLLIAALVLVTVLLPVLSGCHGSDPDRFERVYRRGTEAVVGAMVPIAGLLAFMAPSVVALAYEPEFAAAARPLAVLSITLLLLTVSAWQAVVLLAAGQQRVTLVYNAAALAVSVGLHLVLIPWFGYMGAAVGTVGTTLLTAGASTALARRRTGARLDRGRLGRIAAANVLAATVLGLVRVAGAGRWPAAATGLASYPLWLQALGLGGLGQLRRAVAGGVPQAVPAA